MDEDHLPEQAQAPSDASDADDAPEADGSLFDGPVIAEAVDDESDEDEAGLQDELEDELEDETEFATVAAAATIEEARRVAVEQLRKVVPSVAESDVEFIVLDEGSRGGFFGRGKSQARVEARLRPTTAGAAPATAAGDDEEAAERLRAFLERTLELMGIATAVEVTATNDGVRADLSGDDLGLLIGRHGSTIDALQYVAAIVVNGDRRQRRQVVVDAEGYRVRRESILRALAERTAQRVARDGSPVALKPMSAAERKVIHLYLKDHPRVETASEGNEPFRAVVVSPRRRS